MRAFEVVEDVNGFDISKDRWFRTLGFLLQGYLLVTLEDFAELIDLLINL